VRFFYLNATEMYICLSTFKHVFMKLLFILSFVVLTATSCSRSKSQPAENGTFILIGKWNYTGYSDGGSGQWSPPPAGQTLIEFNDNGTMSSNVATFSGFTNWHIQTDSLVMTAPPSASRLSMGIDDTQVGTLMLTPPCAQQCKLRFVKQ
jgi:hypothetical protein